MEIFARLRLKAQKWWMEMKGQQKTAPSPLPPYFPFPSITFYFALPSTSSSSSLESSSKP